MSGTSHPEGKDWALRMVQAYAPVSILDIGAGSGTYSRLWRDRLPADVRWTALEVHAPYIERYRLHDLYDEVMIADARDGLVPADLALLGDVVEHMAMDDGRALLRAAMACCHALVVSIPLGRYDQGPIDGNDHETHHATWEHADVIDVLGDVPSWRGSVLGCYWWQR